MRRTHCTFDTVFLARKRESASRMSAVELASHERTMSGLRRAVHECRGCDLWRHATQAVFGEGLVRADVVLVGEQPGDKEDIAGHPFAGPAGRMLDEALESAGIDREQVYVTTAVKHFRWKARGKRRIHDKPNAAEIAVCRPGSTGSSPSSPPCSSPSEPPPPRRCSAGASRVLRAPDGAARRARRRELAADLAVVGELLSRVAHR